MRTIFAEYNPNQNSIDVYTSAGFREYPKVCVNLQTDVR